MLTFARIERVEGLTRYIQALPIAMKKADDQTCRKYICENVEEIKEMLLRDHEGLSDNVDIVSFQAVVLTKSGPVGELKKAM